MWLQADSPTACVRRGAVLGALLALLVPAATPHAEFVDVAEEAGVSYVQQTPAMLPGRCEITGNRRFNCEPQRMTGGAAVGDYDNDGWDDLFVTRYRQSSILFRNNGDGTFTDVTETSGITLVDYANTPGWFDIEHDGDLDLMVVTTGGLRNYLFVNDGTGFFTEEAEARGIADNKGTVHLQYGIAFGDYDGDGWTDVFTTEWGSHTVLKPSDVPHSRLFKNRGAGYPGHFVDMTMRANVDLRGLEEEGKLWGFAPAFTDLDLDGRPDLAVVGDFGAEFLLWNNGDGTFADGTDAAGVGTSENGMGSAFGDYDLDGDLDWFVTSIHDPNNTCETLGCNWGSTGNRFYRNDGNRVFTDVTDLLGVREGWWGWGTVFLDVENDTDLDLVMTNGVEFPGSASALGPFTADPMCFWLFDESTFYVEKAQELGTSNNEDGKGMLTFDYDRDGDQDLFVVNNSSTPFLYRNNISGNAWLRIRFEADGKPYDLLNAKVWVTPVEGGPVLYRETGVSSHFLGQSERTLHFGLGATPPELMHQVEVEFPKSKQRLLLEDTVAPNQEFVITVPEEERSKEAPLEYHDADFKQKDGSISLSELLRVIQLNSFKYYRRSVSGEDGFRADPAQSTSTTGYHNADYNPPDWQISVSELLRVIQLYNATRYVNAPEEEDGFLPIFGSK